MSEITEVETPLRGSAKVGPRNFPVDPEFDPDKWEKKMLGLDPTTRRDIKILRKEFSLTSNSQMMNDVLNDLKSDNPAKKQRLMNIEAQNEDYFLNEKGEYVHADTNRPVSDGTLAKWDKIVSRAIILSHPRLAEFPQYARDAIKRRI